MIRGLREKIHKNSPDATRISKNESECSFTLTSEDEDPTSKSSFRNSKKLSRGPSANKRTLGGNGSFDYQSTRSRGRKHTETTGSEIDLERRTYATEEDDKFLEQLKKENLVLEMELKQLQEGGSLGGVGGGTEDQEELILLKK